MSWQEEFEAAMANFGTTLEEPVEYRLHYDLGGNIVQCTMQNHPKNTEYIIVDKEIYGNYARYHVNVDKKKLIKIDTNPGVIVQLKSSTQGFKTVKNHAGLILEPDETYTIVEYYEANN